MNAITLNFPPLPLPQIPSNSPTHTSKPSTENGAWFNLPWLPPCVPASSRK